MGVIVGVALAPVGVGVWISAATSSASAGVGVAVCALAMPRLTITARSTAGSTRTHRASMAAPRYGIRTLPVTSSGTGSSSVSVDRLAPVGVIGTSAAGAADALNSQSATTM